MAAELTIVNGIGLWNSWTRNFKTPILACLDLLDNSFDAALSTSNNLSTKKNLELDPLNAPSHDLAKPEYMNGGMHLEMENDDGFTGKIHVTSFSKECNDDLAIPTPISPKSGIRILNNSSKPIQPLVQILEVYRSDKGKNTESVGENGVGLKQGCATLSDVSFVISKNHAEKRLELGVIAFSLQKEEGVRLPSFSMSYKMQENRPEEVDLIALRMAIEFAIQNDEGVKECVAKLGLKNFHNGLKELTKHCEILLSPEWGDDAFCVLLSELRHEGTTKLLNDLYEDLPKNYIHIPPKFECYVERKRVQFAYWQNRLVELSSFKIEIDSQNVWHEKDKSMFPKKLYDLNLYMGFDPFRINTGGSCSMYIYSRQSGRLIKYDKDARATLGLVASGTTFSQGMVVLVDDFGGNLPLSPSKQDIAFGEEEHGKTHEINVLAYTAGCAHLYWHHNLEKVNGLKKSLGNRVGDFQMKIIEEQERVQDGSIKFLPLERMNMTKFYSVMWMQTQWKTLRPNQRMKNPFKVSVGPDTKFQITRNKPKRQRKKREPEKQVVESSDSDNSPIPRRLKKVTPRKSARKTIEKEASSDSGNESSDYVTSIFLSDEVAEWAKNAKKEKKDFKKEDETN